MVFALLLMVVVLLFLVVVLAVVGGCSTTAGSMVAVKLLFGWGLEIKFKTSDGKSCSSS